MGPKFTIVPLLHTTTTMGTLAHLDRAQGGSPPRNPRRAWRKESHPRDLGSGTTTRRGALESPCLRPDLLVEHFSLMGGSPEVALSLIRAASRDTPFVDSPNIGLSRAPTRRPNLFEKTSMCQPCLGLRRPFCISTHPR